MSSPSDIICSYESILIWYVQGGHWIHFGFLMYVAVYRNPESGAEIHNATYRWSGIMMRLSIVKSAENEEEQQYDEDNLTHGTKVL